jgi:uncharacterized protein (DUF1919 family)
LYCLKENFFYHIVRATQINKTEKLQKIAQIDGQEHARSHYRRCMILLYKEKLVALFLRIHSICPRISGCIQSIKNKHTVSAATKSLSNPQITIISQNCIGGVLYHDLHQQFLSPTINLFIPAPDYMKFVKDLRKYLSLPLQMRWDEEYPIGYLDDIEIHFMHYETCHQARQAWERRCQRIRWDRILVLSTDRDGFTNTEFEQWKQLPYCKVLFTAQRAFADHEDSVYFDEYRSDGCIPDLIPRRMFYRNGRLVQAMQRCVAWQ